MHNNSAFLRRLAALTRKEMHQMWRDKSNMLVGLILPLVLILLFGYGLSFDVKNAPVALVLQDSSPTVQSMAAGFDGSLYMRPIRVGDMATAGRLLNDGTVVGIVQVPSDFSARLAAGGAQVQLITNGVDSSTAQTVEGYVSGVLGTWSQQQAARGGKAAVSGGVTVVQRMWFNETGNSTWYLVPGLLVLVLTLIGAFLTSMLIAREWERGTLESLFVTPVKPFELTLAKIAPYMIIGAVDVAICLLAARFLFDVPMRGSLAAIILASTLYLLVALLLGLWISGVTRSQFQASQLSLLASFMPAMMLSGFVFDLRNVPLAVQVISNLLPATHFMEMIKTLFLAGDNWALVAKDCAILGVYAAVLIFFVSRTLRKTLDTK